MQTNRIVVFDIETIPDLSVGRTVLGLEPEVKDADVREGLGARYAREGQAPSEAFVKTPLHKVVCIGALYAEQHERHGEWSIDRAGVAYIGPRSEQQLIAAFLESLTTKPAPQLVGFNSLSFDLPVLRYRLLHHALPAAVLHRGNGRDYWYRYGKDHLDLCDLLSGYGASPKPSLSEACALYGLDAKSGIDGSEVEGMIRSGMIEEVSAYCERDVFATYLLFLRFALVAGELSADGFRHSLAGCRSLIKNKMERRPQLLQFARSVEHQLASAEPSE